MQMGFLMARKQPTQGEAGSTDVRVTPTKRTEKSGALALHFSQSPKYSVEGALDALRTALKTAHR